MSVLWLLEQSIGAAVLVVLFGGPTLYGAVVLVGLLIAIAVAYRGNELDASTPPHPATLAMLALAPALMLVLGSGFSADTAVSAGIPETGTLVAVLHALLAVEFLLVPVALWRFRSRLVFASAVAIPLLVWAIGAWAVAGMAITGDWI